MSIRSKASYKRIQKNRGEDTQKGRQAVALYLLNQGLAVSNIVFATGLTPTEIEKLKLEKVEEEQLASD